MTKDEAFFFGTVSHMRFMQQLTELSRFMPLARVDFDLGQAMQDFDCLMQGYMLKIAIADGDISAEEISYIRNVCDKADVLDAVRVATKGRQDISWENLCYFPSFLLSGLVELIEKVCSSYCKKFLVPFIRVNEIVEQDILSMFTFSISLFFQGLAAIDGESENAGEELAVSSVIKTFENIWNQLAISMGFLTEKGTASSSQLSFRQPSTNSTLKSRYQPQMGINPMLLYKRIDSNIINPPSPYMVDYRSNSDIFLETILYIETNRGSGTGFIFNPQGYAITCAHVVIDASEIYVRVGTSTSKVRMAKVLFCEPELDIAVLLVEGSDFYSATIDYDNRLLLGDEIIILGYPFGSKVADNVIDMGVSFTRGYISSRQRKNHMGQVLLDVSAKAGNSGSPVISRRNGQVIGILCGSILNNSGSQLVEEINYMRPIKYLERLLAE